VVADGDVTVSHEWLGLADGEEPLWQAQPRILKAVPGVLVGLAIAVGGLVGAGLEMILLAGLAPVGLLVAIHSVLSNRRTWYVVTTRALYRKSGVLGRTVRSVEYDRVQNSQYRQSALGTVFDHGSIEIDVAGEDDLTFRAIYDPDEVLETIQTQIDVSPGRERSSTGSRNVPGTREEWAAVRDELRQIRTTLESNSN